MSDHKVNIFIRDQLSNESDKAFGASQIAGIVIAVAVILGVFLMNRKKNLNDFSEPSVKQESVVEDIHYDNPLYGNYLDDPFKQDFDEVGNIEEYVL